MSPGFPAFSAATQKKAKLGSLGTRLCLAKMVSLSRNPSSTKRSLGLSSVLQSIGKKPKMSVLEKSRVDWLHYKKEEGIEEELKRHSKDG